MGRYIYTRKCEKGDSSMLRGIYIAGTGMLNGQRRMDVTANNLANAATDGYKKDTFIQGTFQDVLLTRMQDGRATALGRGVGPLNYGVRPSEVATNLDSGSLRYSGKNTDLALQGNGFFVVETNQGLRYTRNGAYSVDANGYLMTGEGWPLMAQQGPLRVSSTDFFIDENGNVFEDGVYRDSLLLVDVLDPGVLTKEGSTLMQDPLGEENRGPFTGELKQGYLESSNVELTEELLTMMTIMRQYDSSQRVFKMLDDTLGKAVNEIGRL